MNSLIVFLNVVDIWKGTPIATNMPTKEQTLPASMKKFRDTKQ
jgi:hypothetical protein